MQIRGKSRKRLHTKRNEVLKREKSISKRSGQFRFLNNYKFASLICEIYIRMILNSENLGSNQDIFGTMLSVCSCDWYINSSYLYNEM